jgi:acetylserotonin N-methyltransferase
MTLLAPSTDDRPVWDVWLSMWWLPSVTVADELGIFDACAERPVTPRDVAERLGLSDRGIGVLLPMLASLGFLALHEGRFGITDTTRNFLLSRSPFYWGGVFARHRVINSFHATLKDAVTGKAVRPVGQSSESPPAEAWESGRIGLDQAREIARFMQSHSLPSATGVALHGDFGGVVRLLDVGGGSGCFAIALAQARPELRCTVMDLPAMCEVAREYIDAAGVGNRVDTRGADMFRQEWPAGYDAVFLSNVLHDWSAETCAQLAASAHAALPPGGRVYVHEMLLDDSGAGPRTAAAFSMLMLTATRGRQFTFEQMRTLLEDAGFVDVSVTATYAYYSLIRATKLST